MSDIQWKSSTKHFELDGVLFPPGINFSLFPDTDIVERIRLKVDTIINGLLFKAGTLFLFWENGLARSGTLARNETCTVGVYTITFAANRNLQFNNQGKINYGHSLTTDSILIPKIKLAEGRVVFDRNERLIECVTGEELTFYGNENRVLKTKPGSRILMDYVQTRPVMVWASLVSNETKWGSFVISTKGPVRFFPPSVSGPFSRLGQIRGFNTGFELFYQGFYIQANSPVVLYSDKSLKSFILGRDTTINGIMLRVNTTLVELFENGKLKKIVSSHRMTIQGNRYNAYSQILFDQSGSVINLS